MYGFNQSWPASVPAGNTEASTQSECDTAIINTYLNSIRDISEDFYSEYFTIEPRIGYYSVKVKEINSGRTNNPTSLITFLSEPFVGPHVSIGIDEITISADYTGSIALKEFKHIKSYRMPDHLKGLMIKEIPGIYE